MKFFRLISVLEGLSLITLLFIAMPLRTYADMPLAVTYAGWVHGILFIIYGATSLIASHLSGWSVWKWLLVLFLGVVPFGFLYVDRIIRRESSPTGEAETA
ncbi:MULTISPECIES: DUF3817 domain-containing protein [unclassified Thioalkalivibrio]|uniref:DUF3817 domain-containing protein n=1 Tax=unclassified Thioalkalivibrio TaxID=2621013 RepID=UPI0003763403|nr:MULTISPECIES: DUF3817 domain-containing protein [unclassified Thioalkalivibrio]